MKIKEQTRKLAAGCSKHSFEVADETDEVSNHTYGKVKLTWFEEIFEEYDLTNSQRRNYMTQHLTAEALRKDFLAVFGQEADQTFFSPGRINLIGEHTDYNGGHVFPAAITLGTYGAARKRDDKVLRFFSGNFEDKGIIEVPLENLRFEKEHNWTNYPKGVLHFLQEAGHVIDKGFDFYVYGNIPNGAGLSSSASLKLLTGVVAE